MDILITGATQGGIGFETAKELLQNGHRVFIVGRDTKKTQDTINALATYGNVVKAADALELEDLNSVRAFAKGFKQPSLNMLINNAGITSPLGLKRTKQGFESHMGINYIAHYLLTRLLLDKLLEGAKKSGITSRIINVSSDALMWADVESSAKDIFQGVEPYETNAQYGASKLYQLWDTADINRRYASSGATPSIVALALHPGIVQTMLTRDMPDNSLLDALKDSKDPRMRVLTPAEGAKMTLICATASLAELKVQPPLKTMVDQIPYFKDLGRAPKLSKRVLNKEKMEEVLTETEATLKQRSFL